MPSFKITDVDDRTGTMSITSAEHGAVVTPLAPIIAMIAAHDPIYLPILEGDVPASKLVGEEIDCDDETLRILGLST